MTEVELKWLEKRLITLSIDRNRTDSEAVELTFKGVGRIDKVRAATIASAILKAIRTNKNWD